MITREENYTIADLGLGEFIKKLDVSTPSFQNSFGEGVNPNVIDSGDLRGNIQQKAGVIYSGKTAFDNTVAGYRLGMDGTTAKFYIGDASTYLNWNGSTLVIVGTLTASAGAIGGWTINSTSIYTGTEDHSGYTTNAGDMTIYSNGTDASIHAFKWYIDTSGVLHSTEGDLSGVSIASIPNNSSTDISLLGWTHDIVFSASDADTVAWASGTITLSNARTFSISGGNTGNISARTYIYLDTGVSSTVLQTTTTAATAIGANKILVAVAVNSTDKAEFQTFGGTGTRNILVDNIASNSSSTNEFVANTANIKDAIITNAKVSDLAVSKLTAGTVTSQSITLAANGSGDAVVKSGKTDFDNTTAGFILGVDDSDSDKAKFYIGDSTSYINWDGTTLTVVGVSNVAKTYTAGESIAAGNAVFVEDVSMDISKRNIDGNGVQDRGIGQDTTGTEIVAQGFVESSGMRVTKIKVWLKKTGSPADNIRVSIQGDSGGNPDGTPLASATLAGASITTSYVEYTFTLSAEVNITPSVQYWIVLDRTGALSDTDYYLVRVSTDNPYSPDNLRYKSGADSSWNDEASEDIDFEILLTTVAGRIYNASARTVASHDEYSAFVGFTSALVAGGSTVPVYIAGEATGFSGLTPGGTYKLAGTATTPAYGTVSTGGGTNSRKVGIATSATTLLITNIW